MIKKDIHDKSCDIVYPVTHVRNWFAHHDKSCDIVYPVTHVRNWFAQSHSVKLRILKHYFF